MEFWDRTKACILAQNTTQQWVSEKIGVPFTSFRGWITKKRLPHADEAVAIARALDTTAEELVLGERGKNYVMSWAQKYSPKLRAPPGLEALCDDLKKLDGPSIEIVQATVKKIIEVRAGIVSESNPRAKVS